MDGGEGSSSHSNLLDFYAILQLHHFAELGPLCWLYYSVFFSLLSKAALSDLETLYSATKKSRNPDVYRMAIALMG